MRENDNNLLYALRSVFRPIANLLLKNRVGIGPVIEQLKLAYVEAARDHHGRSGRPASVNRISELTGMSRGHVSDLLSATKGPRTNKKMEFPKEADVLAEWATNEKYLDDVGLPRDLDYGPGEGTFMTLLAESVGAREVENFTTALLRSKNVTKTGEGKLRFAKRVFPMTKDLPRQMLVSMASLAHTIDCNWSQARGFGHLQRVAHTGKLDSSKIPLVRRVLKERTENFIEEVDNFICTHECDAGLTMKSPDGHNLARLGLGVYYFEIPEQD